MSTGHPPLADQIAVVTGSSRGIGQTIALALASAGAQVVVHGHRHQDDAWETVADITRQGGTATARFADVSQAEQSSDFVDACWSWQGHVDIWVNNAGADVLTGEARQQTFEQKLARLWQVDVQGTILLSRLAGQRMSAGRGGVILNIGWDQAETGMAGESGEMFAATKGAIMAFSRSLAKSLAPRVRVNCLAPGWIRTQWGHEASAYWQARAVRESLRDRWGTPEDVARAALFLVSPDADFVTGQVLAVNGGLAGLDRLMQHQSEC